ncbi:MAG: TIGR03936 family radical SAM-associated protein, partial [Myxococcota bacterium]
VQGAERGVQGAERGVQGAERGLQGAERGTRAAGPGLVLASTPGESEKADRKKRRRELDRLPMAGEDQGPPTRVRIGFAKVGRIAYSSHLDLVRLFPRWFRRCELPVYWSGGFHPRPQMAFSPALSLGISSTGEYLDLKLRRRDFSDAMMDSLIEDLNDKALDGVEVFGARRLGDTDKALGRILGESIWVAALPRQLLRALTLEGQTGIDNLKALDEHIVHRRASALTVTRVRKGIGRKVDVGRALTCAEVGQGAETLAAAGLIGDLIPFRFGTDMADSGTAKPTEVLRAFFGDEFQARLVREGVYARYSDRRIAPLDLEGLRSAEQARRAAKAADVEA